jgi:hypothetical protein
MLRHIRYLVTDLADGGCGCLEAPAPGDRVRVRYDAWGQPWLVAQDDGPDEACCDCAEPVRGPRPGAWTGAYGRSRATRPATRECTE